jgi:hypothetical protein
MRVTLILRDIKKWLSVLHPQIPLSDRESGRLLNAITGSFRARLDEVHPTRAHDPPPDGKAQLSRIEQQASQVQFRSVTAKTSDAPSHHFASAVESADRHLASVLTSPLFAGPATVKTARKKSTPKPRSAHVVLNAATDAETVERAATVTQPDVVAAQQEGLASARRTKLELILDNRPIVVEAKKVLEGVLSTPTPEHPAGHVSTAHTVRSERVDRTMSTPIKEARSRSTLAQNQRNKQSVSSSRERESKQEPHYYDMHPFFSSA